MSMSKAVVLTNYGLLENGAAHEKYVLEAP
jgi:hypothetical protein